MCWRPGRQLPAAEFLDVERALPAFSVERTQSLSHADLRRLLPRLLGDAAVAWSAGGFTASWEDGRSLQLVLSSETERRIGSLRIISTPLQLIFLHWTPSQRETFLLKCERALQQGGG